MAKQKGYPGTSGGPYFLLKGYWKGPALPENK
jgi:hypothetical protein